MSARICALVLAGAIVGGVLAVPLAHAQQAGADIFQVATSPALRNLIERAEARLAEDDAAGAYALLAPAEADHAGHPVYDYLLGIAALDTGRISEAVFSLQRSLDVAPAFSGARLELARAYYEYGDRARARRLFEATLAESPPPQIRAVVNRYLDAINAAPAQPEARFLPYAALSAGYDGNANGSTADGQFMGFTLNPNNVETESAFFEPAAGFNWLVPASNRAGWHVSARASHRHNPDADFVDASIVSGNVGFNWRYQRVYGRIAGGGYHGARDGSSNERYLGGDLQLGRRFGDYWDIALATSFGQQRYDDSIDVLDVDRRLNSLTLTRRFAGGGRVSLAVIDGEDEAREAGSPHGNDKSGLSLSLVAVTSARSHLVVSAGRLDSDYGGLFFGASRNDEQQSLSVEWRLHDAFIEGLSIAPKLRWQDNDSTISLYRYDRLEAGVELRWTRQ